MTAADRTAYATAGVDVAAGERAVELLRGRLARSPMDVLGGIGGFGAAMALPPGYREPVLVAATDGVGTKTEIARSLGRFDTIGRDLVAMCVDDVVCHGARPLFFLDYLAVGRVDPVRVAAIVGGVAEACAEVGCALVGGETAEHPGLMEPDAFDIAGFCLGVVEREDLLDGTAARTGDVIVGLASSGIHANGLSLVRALVARHGLDLGMPLRDALERHDLSEAAAGIATDRSLGDELLTPTRVYASAVLDLRDRLGAGGLRLGGVAHVTGGGLPANLPRAVPAELGVIVDPSAWPQPPVFDLLAALGGIDAAEMRATFNCGVGMALTVEQDAVGVTIEHMRGLGITAQPIGEVVPAAAAGSTRYLEVTPHS